MTGLAGRSGALELLARYYDKRPGKGITAAMLRDGMVFGAIATEAAVSVIEQALAAPAADGWRPIESAPKSVADGSRVSGIYLLGFNPDPELDFDPQACIDIIWWEPLLPNNAGGRGKWCRQAGGDAIESAPTHWMPLPAAPQAQGEGA